MYQFFSKFFFLLNGNLLNKVGLYFISKLNFTNKITHSLISGMEIKMPFGLDFHHPIGLAAGLDKNGKHIKGLNKLGFSFIEVGTATPKPQPGNPQPNIQKYPKQKLIFNWMGFPNEGVVNMANNLSAVYDGDEIIGANIGMQKDSKDPYIDYAICARHVCGIASYITINISSPNTQNLRDLQSTEHVSAICNSIRSEIIRTCKTSDLVPKIFLKIAPDITDEQAKELTESAVYNKLDAIIATNTTVARPNEFLKEKFPKGGMSGSLLKTQSTHILKEVYKASGGRIPIIASGGIISGEDVFNKMLNGASLVQIYSALIYRGPYAVEKILKELRYIMDANNVRNLSDIIGSAVQNPN